MKPTHLDLFTGLGAFSIGFEREGFQTIAQVEIEKSCLKLLASKWPSVLRHNDVTTFDPDSIPCPSVVTFGSPCQDLSVAGQRAGMAGERSGLFYHATRIIQRLVGRGLEFALWENVEGAFSSNGGRDFAGVLAELGRCGAMDIGYRVLDCQFWGLAQRRRRVFVVADFRAQRCAQILSFESCLRGHPETRREAGQEVAPTIGGCSNGGGVNGPGRDVDSCESLIPDVAAPCGHHHRRDDLDNNTYLVMSSGQANAECVRDGEPSLTCNHEALIVIPIQSVNMVREKKHNGIGIGQGGDEMFTLTGRDQHAVAIGFDSKQGGDTQLGAMIEGSPPLKGINRHAVAFQACIARNGRGVPSCAVSALQASATGDSKPLLAGNFGVRRLTPTECERLMGLPDGWTSGFSDSVRYRMIGNSAAVPVIKWLARAIKQAL